MPFLVKNHQILAITELSEIYIELAKDYLTNLDEATLGEIIDESYTPPVSRQARIVSIIDDAVMHSGQAIYTRRMVIGK